MSPTIGITIFFAVLAFIGLGALTFIIFGIIDQEEDLVKGAGIVLTFVIIIFATAYQYKDEIITKRADEFFATREAVYECKNQGPLQCKYNINKWQLDSTAWVEALKEKGIKYESND